MNQGLRTIFCPVIIILINTFDIVSQIVDQIISGMGHDQTKGDE